MKKFISVGSAATGSQVLTRLMKDCGVFLGNDKCQWVDAYEIPNHEHGYLQIAFLRMKQGPKPWMQNLEKEWTRRHAALYEEENDEVVLEAIRNVYMNYMLETERLGLGAFMTKFSGSAGRNEWKYMRSIVESVIPDPWYIKTIRHPLSCARGDINQEEPLRNWMALEWHFIDILDGGGSLVRFPEDWLMGEEFMQGIVENALGLSWNPEAFQKFDVKGREHTILRHFPLMDEFRKRYPEVQATYERIIDHRNEKMGLHYG